MDEQYYLQSEPAIIIDQDGQAQPVQQIPAPQQQQQEQQQQLENPEQAVVDQHKHLEQQQQQQEEDEDIAEEAGEDDLMGSDGLFSNVSQGLRGHYRDMMMNYWQETINSIETQDHDFKNHQLPLARIKKVMKTDEEVRMISAEAPILFAKGCDIFITELTMRAWIHAEENKRRTLQKSDIAAALQRSDMFDFLIDVVPREEDKRTAAASQGQTSRQGSYVHQPHTASSTSIKEQAIQQPQGSNDGSNVIGSSSSTNQEGSQFDGAYQYNEINYDNGTF